MIRRGREDPDTRSESHSLRRPGTVRHSSRDESGARATLRTRYAQDRPLAGIGIALEVVGIVVQTSPAVSLQLTPRVTRVRRFAALPFDGRDRRALVPGRTSIKASLAKGIVLTGVPLRETGPPTSPRPRPSPSVQGDFKPSPSHCGLGARCDGLSSCLDPVRDVWRICARLPPCRPDGLGRVSKDARPSGGPLGPRENATRRRRSAPLYIRVFQARRRGTTGALRRA